MTRLLLIILIFLSSGPAYAEWILIDNDKPGMTIYVNPDTITRKGDLVKMWELFDFETAEHVADTSHLSFKMLSEYDCTEGRKRELAMKSFSGNMGRGKVVHSYSPEGKWESVTPGSLDHVLWEFACGKGQSSGQTPAASPPSDISIADLQTLQTQAAQGHAEAQYSLGVLYAKGHGVPQGYAQAAKWYEQAAAQGQAQAQFNLGWLYYAGLGVPQDYTKARHLYEQAAAQGHAQAQGNLAELYYAGLGVPQDDVRAYLWVSLAAARMTGDEQKQAAGNRDEVAGRMTPAQIAEAQRLSQQCQAQQFKGC
mgnify:CR=1 FL=1